MLCCNSSDRGKGFTARIDQKQKMAMAAMGMGSAPFFTAPHTIKPPFLNPLPSSPPLSLSRSNANCRGASLSFAKTKKHNVCCCQVKLEDEACELVNGVEVSIGEEGDSIDAYLLTAVKNNNGTGILLLSDVFGFEDSFTRDFAYRVACNGYNVLIPDLFRGDPWRKDHPDASFEQWIGKHDRNRVIKDTFASVEWMVDEFVAAGISKKLGLIGFCYGGGLTVDILAKDQGSSFGAGISFYGTRINTDISTKIKAPLLLISGDDDPLCPVSVLNNVAENVEKSKVVVFKGRGHGFVHRPQSPEEDKDAEEAFVIMRSWFCDYLVEEK